MELEQLAKSDRERVFSRPFVEECHLLVQAAPLRKRVTRKVRYNKILKKTGKTLKTFLLKPAAEEIEKDDIKEFFTVVREGDAKKLRTLLEETTLTQATKLVSMLNRGGEYGPLHIAARFNHVEVAKLLIAQGARVDMKGNDDITPLHMASR